MYYEIEGVGKIKLTRRRDSHRLSMRIKPDGYISVSCPFYASSDEILTFVKKNKDWISKQQSKIESQTTKYTFDQRIPIRDLSIKIIKIERGIMQSFLNKEEVMITIPPSIDINSERAQNFIKHIIVETCRLEAKLYLPMRVNQLANEHGFKYEQVFIKNLKSKWGSCSTQKNINLNLHLVRVSDQLIDYIILHELAHTREMNHGPAFWALLNKVTNGKARELDKAMKAQSHKIPR